MKLSYNKTIPEKKDRGRGQEGRVGQDFQPELPARIAYRIFVN